MDSIETVRMSMETYWQDTAALAQSVSNIISFERQSVKNWEIEALVEANAGLRAANNVLVEIRRQSDTPLVARIEKLLDSAISNGTSHPETLRIYNNVIKTLEGK